MKNLLRKGYHVYQQIAYPKFFNLRKATNGMLHPRAYKKIYEYISRLEFDLDIVEIGGASGTASIAIAWALQDSGKTSRLIMIEKCEGGSRIDSGGYAENINIIQQNLKKFGVEEKILLYPHELTFKNGQEVLSLINTSNISALILDADGRLDRDFSIFWPILRPGGLIILDDYRSKATYKPMNARHPQGGIKPVQVYRLLNKIAEWGLFKFTYKMGDVVFGYKPPDADFNRFDLDVCQNIIEEIYQERTEYLDKNQSKQGK